MQSISANRTVQPKPQPPARRKGSKAQQTEDSPAGFTADGFLRHRFIPLYEPSENLPAGENPEKELFSSLAVLQSHFPLNLPDVEEKSYPYNILLTYWEAQKLICGGKDNIELYIIKDEDKAVKFAIRETVFNNNTLYYIPVLPLYRLMQNRRRRNSANLLLSVCAYLCQIANIPHYRDQYSYIGGHYEMLREWLTDPYNDWEENDVISNKCHLDAADHYGDIMLDRMYHRYHLDNLPKRIEAFKPADQFDRDCLAIAKKALALYTKHPDGHLFKHVNKEFDENGEIDEDEDGYYDDRRDSTLMVDQYVHFIAEGKGSVYDNLVEMVNDEFKEKSHAQEANLLTCYDNKLSEHPDSLAYEYGLFALIDQLYDLLIEL